MVLLVSFLVNNGSGVIRQAIERVAIAGSPSAATVIVLFPVPSQGSVRRGVLEVVVDFEGIQARPPVTSMRSQ